MSETPQPPAPDGSALTPEEWDAVRRLRGANPEPSPSVTEPEPVEQATATPLPPVAPSPPPEHTAPPVEQTAPAVEQAVDETPTVATATDERPPTSRGSGGRARRFEAPALPAVAALVVLAVAAAVLASLVGLKVSDRRAHDRAATAAIAAATTGVSTVLSYNYRSLDNDFAKAEALLTPSFRKDYATTTAKAVQPLAAKYKAVSTAQVRAAGVITASTSHATVLVFVSQQVTNTQLSAPRLDQSRIQVELVHTHGSWLINKLTPV